MAALAEAKALKLEDETIRVVWMILFRGCPPTNPAVVLKAMRDWYLEFGNDPVLRVMADWLGQIIGYDPKNHDSYTVGQAHFTEKTGLDLDSNLDGASNGR